MPASSFRNLARLPSLLASSAFAALFCIPLPSEATLVIFEHGSGVKSLGAGGVGYAVAEEATALPANPAHAASLGNRYDLGVDVLSPLANARIEGNLFGTDERYLNDRKRYYPIPQAAFTREIDERWSWGMSMFSAGLGPDYKPSPYQRFGGAERVSLSLGSAGVSTVLAVTPTPDHAFGVGLNLGYQLLRIKGAEFLGFRLPLFRVSETPDRVTNQGRDDVFNIGYSVGWSGLLSPKLAMGASYRSQTWTQKHHEYKGLLPEQGQLDLPPIWGVGLAYMPDPAWTLAFDYQCYENEAVAAFGNPIANLLRDRHLLGSDRGPGFGFKNMHVYKFGVSWLATPKLTLRVGFLDATQPVRSSETLFSILGPVTATQHYSAGFTYAHPVWEVSAFYAHAPEDGVDGEGSVPLLFGGGEAKISIEVHTMGLSFGRRFDL